MHDWFERFGECCAAVDYEAAKGMFTQDVVSFGTKMNVVEGLESLMVDQWHGIWPKIREFRFDLDTLHAGGDDVVWGVCLWTSIGFDRDGESFPRPGRATVILEREAGRWLASHTHFSLFPGTPPRTYGEAP